MRLRRLFVELSTGVPVVNADDPHGARLLAELPDALAFSVRAGSDAAIVMDELARHGFWASAVIRLVPTLPSIVINAAAGCTPMRFRDFIAGTAIGSVPKMALIAFASHAAIRGIEVPISQ